MLLNKRLFALFAVLFLCLGFCSACSSQGRLAEKPEEAAGENDYLQVYENNAKAWFFLADSVRLYVEEESEPVLEVLVRIDYKQQRVTEIVLWYVRVEESQYKATRTDSYDQDEGFVLDSWQIFYDWIPWESAESGSPEEKLINTILQHAGIVGLIPEDR